MRKSTARSGLSCPWYLDEMGEGESNCLTCIKRNLSMFSELGREDLIRLNENKRFLYFTKGETVFKQNLRPAGLYALSQGKVKNIRISEAGGTQLIDLNQPVNFIGFSDFISDHHHSYSAVAIENCTVCFIPSDDFMEVLRNNTTLSLRSMQFISNQHRRYLERTCNLSGKNMRGRMADTLMYIYDLFEGHKKNNVINLDLTRSDYGSLAQMNTANAIRTLSEFSKRGLIEFNGPDLSFKNVAALRQISLKE